MGSVQLNQGIGGPDRRYLLGHGEDEELRLRRQATELHEDSARLFDCIASAQAVGRLILAADRKECWSFSRSASVRLDG